MRFFMTGASGWIGSAAAKDLLASGHEIVGLVRSEDSAAALRAAGVQAVAGTLDDLDTLGTAAADSDGVVHLAFRHDIAFSGDFQGAVDADRRAIETFGDALAGTDRRLIVASGTLGLAPGRVGTECDRPDPAIHPRIANAHLTLALTERGVRSSVIRFAPTVHGPGDHGFTATLVEIARRTGVAGYVGDGSNRWPAVHRLDAAQLVRLAAENAPAGAVLHATDEDGIPARDIAAAIGRQLGVPVASIPASDAANHFGFLAELFAMDAPASSTLTRELLGWTPTHAGLLADIGAGSYTS
jgi:nucleoside-diphosphate-sugar epimerase